MHLSNLDNVLWLLGVVGELILLGILVYRRTYRTFPIFFSWLVFVLLLEPTFFWLVHNTAPATYYKIFFALNFPQYLLEAGVLIEIAASVLRPVKRSMPKRILYVFAGCMIVIGIIGFILAAHAGASTLAHPRGLVLVNTTMAIL